MDFRTPFHFIARKVLYSWIKTDVLHGNDALLTASTHANIVYVLDSRSWSNLLVLGQECQTLKLPLPLEPLNKRLFKNYRRIYSVANKQPLKAWLHNKNKRSRMLGDLLDAVQQHPEQDILFIPVSVFWGRPIAKEKHWLNVLFSETWGIAGRLRRFFSILLNGKSTLVQFSSAISFRDIIHETGDDVSHNKIIDTLQNRLSTRLNEIKTATLGPDVSHRRTLIRDLLEKPDVQLAIKRRSNQDNISEYKATRIAQKYLTEIVANCNYIAIQLLQRALTAFWNKFYSGIDVYHSKKLHQIALSHELIYVPCHRSHIDYLLLSYVIHSEGLAIPYIAAGNNLNMPIIGSILRKGGAFFIRRSFKGNELYSTVMFEYLASLVSRGMPVEYFVEGGRSRTGRLLKPKPGLLAMTIRTFLKYRQRPIAFIPVSIGYEKMIEGQAYLAELKGDDKKNESLLDSIRAFFSIRGNYGRVSASFGKPVYLNDVLDHQSGQWQNTAFDNNNRPDWLIPTVNETANRIMLHINQASHVNAVNLIATALLSTNNQAMDEGDLLRTIDIYVRVINTLDYADTITVTDIKAEQQIERAENLKLVKRRQHEMGDFIYLERAMAVLLTYYRNNVIHLFALPSLITCCFINNRTLGRDKIIHFITIAYPFLKSELYLKWEADEIEEICDKLLNQLANMGLLIKNEGSDIYSRPRTSALEYAQLFLFAKIISPVLELYYIIFALLANQKKAAPTREKLEQQCYLMAQRISLIHEINSPDFFDKKLIANFIDTLVNLDYVQVNENKQLIISQLAIEKGLQSRHLLDRNIQYNILQMLGSSTSTTD